MADRIVDNSCVGLLRERITSFLSNSSDWKLPLHRVLKRIEQNEWPGVIFGGVPRDLLVLGESEIPRDVDVVVDRASSSDLERSFADLIHEKTRFGGLRLRTKGWLIDVWALGDTWAFQQHLISGISFETLVHTTFLDVEAVAAEINPQRGRPRRIYSAGFFEAIERQTLGINFEPNPFPGLCVVRSMITALRLNFLLSRQLAEYVVRYASRISIEELTNIQESHYGKIRITPTRLIRVLDHVEKQLRETSAEGIRLPTSRAEQLELFQCWTPTI